MNMYADRPWPRRAARSPCVLSPWQPRRPGQPL